MCASFCIGFNNFRLARKTLTDFTDLFSPNNFKLNDDIIWNYFRDSNETPNIYPKLSASPLSDQQQFRLNKINEIKDYFVPEIKERELMSKRFSKFIASFDYFGKSLFVLSVTNGRISIASFETVIEAPVGMASSNFILVFSISTGIVKNLLKPTRNKKKKHNKIVMLARSKLNSIESKISEALINNEISREDFVTIINEKRNYRELKESIRMMNSQRVDNEKIAWLKEAKNRHWWSYWAQWNY